MGKELEAGFDGGEDEAVAGSIGVEAVGKEAIDIFMGKYREEVDEGELFLGGYVFENVGVRLDFAVGVVKLIFKGRGFGFDDGLGTDEDDLGGELLGLSDELDDILLVFFFRNVVMKIGLVDPGVVGA